MKIVKTSQQAKADKAKEDAALDEILICPECGAEIGRPWPLPIERVNWRGRRTRFFHRICKNCGCEWESDEF